MEGHVFGLLILGSLASHVSTLSNGLVHNAMCDAMTPQHGSSIPHTSEPPYIVSASSYSYTPGEQITVTLQAKPGTYFEGFLLQARSVPGNDMVGHFIVTDPKSQILNCREKVNSMVYDKDSSIKSKVWAVWVAPASVSKVIFIARFLQSKKTFWVESPELVVSSSAASSLIGRIQLHRSDVTLSDTKADVSAASNVTHKKHKSHIIVKTHGALMLIAWMTTGSLGMIMARYFKTAAKRPILGKALWFQAHIVFMVLTVAATIVSFVLSFVEHRGWAYDVSTHAILGCLVMILAIIQPFVSILRPSPQSDMRFFFNWFHAVNALLIKVLAVTNLFLGFQFIDYKLGWLVNTMGGFVGWEALAFFCLEINSDLARKEKQKLGDSESPEASVKAEVYLLLIYLCGNMAFLVALLVGIGIS